MLNRILVAVIGVPLLLAVLLVFPPLCLPIMLCLLCALSAYELLWATGAVRRVRLAILSMLMAAAIPFLFYFELGIASFVALLFLFLVVVAVEVIAFEEKLRFEQLAMALFGGVIVPSMLSTLVLISDDPYGRYYVLLPFVTSFISDAFALFVGMWLGKHKLAPTISPKKTVEGSLGGFLGSVLGCVAYGAVVMLQAGVQANFPLLIIFGILGSLLAQMGDLFFSWIKREYSLKDYGRLLPGHGGVLDRFDSVVFCAPFTLLMLQCFTFFYF